MGNESRIIFEPFSLDLVNECLWRDSLAIPLRPKAFEVLIYLLARPGQLVTKEELLEAVWPDTFVGEAVLKVTVRQLRQALGDDPKAARFIETAHRRGYRFIGRISEAAPVLAESRKDASPSPPAERGPITVVGRDEALSRMRGWLEKALGGERQTVFVTGEAGIGKTSLVDAFTRGMASGRTVRVGWGQCLEQYGTSEAYLPVLEAIGRLCRDERHLVDVLRTHAPLWLLQMPALVNASDREVLRQEVVGATRERMLREMSEALEALTADRPLVLILEDLHWSDLSTLDLISYLAMRRQPARFMLIGTYRTVELIVSGHPLRAVKRELLAKQQCEELPLEYLGEEAVADYLLVRFPTHRFPTRLTTLIHERTEGNPLFIVNAVDYLVAERLIVEDDEGWKFVAEIEKIDVGVPDSIKQMIERQVDYLDAGQRQTLEAASVAGAEFSTLSVAAALGEDRASVEALCEAMARQHQFLRDCGVHELPNGDAVTRYGFIHSLYQNVLYERMPASRRVRFHQRIGEEEEKLYGERAREIAAGLAMHFERGSNYGQAVTYLRKASETAIRRFAYQEAIGLSRRGLELLSKLPDTPERTEQELCLQLGLGIPLIATEGYAAPDVGNVYLRARELCGLVGDTPDISEALWGLWTFFTLRAEFRKARAIAEEILSLGERLLYPGLSMRGHWALETTFMHMGEFTPSMGRFEKALSLYEPERHRDDGLYYGQNPGVATRCFAAWTLWFLGLPDRALDLIREAVALARELSEPLGLAHALFFEAVLHQFRRDVRMARERAEDTIAVSNRHGLAMYRAMATTTLGWAQAEDRQQDAIEQIRQGLAGHRATGAEVLVPHSLTLLAEALGTAGQVEEGLRLLEEAVALADRTGEEYYLAEILHVKGRVLLMQAADRGRARAAKGGKTIVRPEPSTAAQAAACFRQSIQVAQRQDAKSWELRAATSLARLFRDQDKKREARDLLARIYGRFTEGFDTADLRDAKALLDEVS